MAVQTRKLDTRSMILCGLFSALIGTGAFIRIPVPVMPFTMQVFFVLLAGLVLGAKGGAIAAGVYMAVGLAGVPVFTAGGGIGYIFHPTFGYLIGFIFGAYAIGKMTENTKDPSYKTMFLALAVGLFFIYAMGMAYYYVIANYYLKSAFSVKSLLIYCFFMTIPGDMVSAVLAAYITKRVHPVLRRTAMA